MKKSFYLQQEEARSRTSRLFVAFHLIVATTAMITTLFYIFFTSSQFHTSDEINMNQLIGSQDNLLVFAIVYLTIILVSKIRSYPLKTGGAYVAKMVGGREISFSTTLPREKQLINIVEEMGIASGMSLPRVFVLDHEESINAFAAGTNMKNACVAVSNGALTKLDRAELQGVVAHEFSHILNGDMALNVHLLGYLYGLTSISDAGRILMRHSSRRSSRNNALPAFGLGLYVIGSLGYFFAFLLKAGISRDRERLADASALQFTRNPEGIGGALRKIWKESYLEMDSSRSAEISHFYFNWPRPFLSFLSTHPPILERIKNLGLNPSGIKDDKPITSEFNQLEAVSALSPSKPEQYETHLSYDPEYYIFAFFLWFEDSPTIGPMDAIIHWNKSLDKDHMLRAFNEIRHMNDQDRFAVIERSLARVRELDPSKVTELLGQMKALIEEDGQISHREFVYYYYLRLMLSPQKKLGHKVEQNNLWESVELVAYFYGVVLKLNRPHELSERILGLLGKKPKKLSAIRMEEIRSALSTLSLSRPLYRHQIYAAFRESLSPIEKKSEALLSLKLLALILEVVD